MANGWQKFLAWLNGPDDEEFEIKAEPANGKTDTARQVSIKMLMLQSAIGYLASGLSMCEFRLLKNDKPVRNREYTRLNLRPNCNQNKSQFYMELVSRLVFFNEVLIVAPDAGKTDLFIADSWTREQRGTGAAIYRDVMVNDMVLRRRFKEDEVMHLTADYQRVLPLLLEVAEQYEDIMSVAITGYARQAGEHGILSIATTAAGSREQREAENSRIKNLFKAYFSNDSAVLPLPSGYNYQATASAHRNTSEINDMINITDEWAERVALALRVPSGILKGNVENTERSSHDLVLYGITPLARQFQHEYNSKRLDVMDYCHDTRLFVDTLPVYMSDLSQLGALWEKGVASGIYSVDDLRELRGDYRLETEESEMHWMTANNGPLGQQNEQSVAVTQPETQQAALPAAEPEQQEPETQGTGDGGGNTTGTGDDTQTTEKEGEEK